MTGIKLCVCMHNKGRHNFSPRRIISPCNVEGCGCERFIQGATQEGIQYLDEHRDRESGEHFSDSGEAFSLEEAHEV